MANYCYFNLKAKGKKKDIEKLYEVLSNHYNYVDGVNIEKTVHLSRIFDCGMLDDEILEEDGMYNCTFEGNCAWSVICCMFSGDHTYYDDYKERFKENCMATTIPMLSKELDLDIEIFSEEPGCGFMEHFLVRKGEIEIEDCVDYEETYDEETDEYGSEGGLEWNYTI